jgi:hypothetical protein
VWAGENLKTNARSACFSRKAKHQGTPLAWLKPIEKIPQKWLIYLWIAITLGREK